MVPILDGLNPMTAFLGRIIGQRAVFAREFVGEQPRQKRSLDQRQKRMHAQDGDQDNNRRQTDDQDGELPKRRSCPGGGRQ